MSYINRCFSMYHANGQITIYLPICFPAPFSSLLPHGRVTSGPLLRGSAESWLQLGFCLYPPSPFFPQSIPLLCWVHSRALGPLHHLPPQPGHLPRGSLLGNKGTSLYFCIYSPLILPSQKVILSLSPFNPPFPEKTGV